MKTAEQVVTEYARRIGELEDALAKEQEKARVLQKMLDEAKRSGAAGSSEILADGEERDFYPSERHEVLIDVLKDARKGLKDGTRRADIIDDIIAHNPVSGEPEKRAKAVKVALKGYRGMDEKTGRKLRELGLTANEQHRKHFMLKYYDDPRYFVTMTASGSDAGRGGKNLASDIIKGFF